MRRKMKAMTTKLQEWKTTAKSQECNTTMKAQEWIATTIARNREARDQLTKRTKCHLRSRTRYHGSN